MLAPARLDPWASRCRDIRFSRHVLFFLPEKCGGSPKTSTTANYGTPAGTYTVTVMGSANGQVHTTAASVAVK